ncbi:hypothetical protein B0T14DRAFT_491697 [Immersiella caudata]|uniref:Uncharacterized protein n=1 Tax=Immersiella caudata TaxID=314043 RepID=A0AA39XHQ1_9PEZI|nr:hypothetical protein B0T14DRAFT_491697 [Immersiella caudata]
MGISTSAPEATSHPSMRTKLKSKLRAIFHPREDPDQDELPCKKSRSGSLRTAKTSHSTPEPITGSLEPAHPHPNHQHGHLSQPPSHPTRHQTRPQPTHKALSNQLVGAYTPYEPYSHPATRRPAHLARPHPIRQLPLLPFPPSSPSKALLTAEAHILRTTSIPAPGKPFMFHPDRSQSSGYCRWISPMGILILSEVKSYLSLPDNMPNARMVISILRRWPKLRAHIACVEPGVVRAASVVDFMGVGNAHGVRHQECNFWGRWVVSGEPLFWPGEGEWEKKERGERGAAWRWERKRKGARVGGSRLRQVWNADEVEDEVEDEEIIGLAL